MKSQTFLIVLGVIAFAAVLVGGVLILSRSRSALEVTAPPKLEDQATAPSPPVEAGKEIAGEKLFSAILADQVGGERSGQVTVFIDAFTGDTKYKVEIKNLAKPESPASYQAWAQTPQGIMGSLGEIKIEEDGTGLLETLGSKPEAGWSVAVTFQEDENPTPGKRILLGTLREE